MPRSTSKLLRSVPLDDDQEYRNPDWRETFLVNAPHRYAERPTLHIRCSTEFRNALDAAIEASGSPSMAAYVLDAVGSRIAAELDISLNDLPEFAAEVITFSR